MKALPLLIALLATGCAARQTTVRTRPAVIVISDIDDTIKDTRVVKETTDRHGAATYRKDYAHMAGDPFRKWQPVDGMAARYRAWSRQGPLEFIYLSKGPWFYHPRVSRFLRTNHFPSGRVALNPCFPITPSEYKTGPIRRIIRAHPGSSFVLVGDSGEDDPEVLGRIAAQFPRNVRHVFIRNVTPRQPPARLAAAFALLPHASWQIFTAARQLPMFPAKTGETSWYYHLTGVRCAPYGTQ